MLNRPPATLATLLVRLGEFALANAGRFRSLDLNPVIVKPAGEGVVVVDIALEPLSYGEPSSDNHIASGNQLYAGGPADS